MLSDQLTLQRSAVNLQAAKDCFKADSVSHLPLLPLPQSSAVSSIDAWETVFKWQRVECKSGIVRVDGY